MLYPSKYVLVTDIDIEKKTEKCFNESKKCTDSEKKLLNFHETEKNCIESKVLSLCDGIHKSTAGAIPERIWQDMIMNPAYTNQAEKSEMKNNVKMSENDFKIVDFVKTANVADAGLWNFVEPCLKSSCSCKRYLIELINYFFLSLYVIQYGFKQVFKKKINNNKITYGNHAFTLLRKKNTNIFLSLNIAFKKK
jgi:hypothetical protein